MKCVLSLSAFLIILFVSSNNARWIPELRILLCCTVPEIFRETSHFQFVRRSITIILLSHLEILKQVHTRIFEKQLKYLRYITVQSCSQLPQEQQPLIFKVKSNVEVQNLGYFCETGSEMNGK
jgi:hypothetical protein